MIYLNWRHVHSMGGVMLCFLLWAAALPAQAIVSADDATLWGVDLQAVQTRPALYQIQLTCYQPISSGNAEGTATVFIQERDVMVGASPVQLTYVAYEDMESFDCNESPIHARKLIYRGDWKRPDYGNWDLYWSGNAPAATLTNIPPKSKLSLTLHLDGINGIMAGNAPSFAGMPSPLLCTKGIPVAAFAWGKEEAGNAELFWEPVYGATPVKNEMPLDSTGYHPADLATRVQAKPLFEPLKNTLQVQPHTQPLQAVAGNNDSAPIEFVSSFGLYLLSAAGVLEHDGQVVGHAKRLWVSALH